MRACAVHVVMRLAFACGAGACVAIGGLVANGCLRPDLVGRACPCIDGYACVNGICVVPSSGCGTGADCEPPLVCSDNGECTAPLARCPARFIPEDVCLSTPPARSTLVAVCDDGTVWEDEMMHLVNGQLCGAAALTSENLAGTLEFTAETSTVTLDVAGEATYRVEVESACVAAFEVQGCVSSAGIACTGDASGCTCDDVTVAVMPEPPLTFSAGRMNGANTYFGCAQPNGTYVMRSALGDQRGPILVFE